MESSKEMMERSENELHRRAVKAAFETRCKHGMLYAHCAFCNEYFKEEKAYVPITCKDAAGNVVFDKFGEPVVRVVPIPVTRRHFVHWTKEGAS